MENKTCGWLSENEGEFLYKKGKAADGIIVEIGSWKGKSTICLTRGSRAGNGQLVYAIDPHTKSSDHIMHGVADTFHDFLVNCLHEGVLGIVKPIRKYSHECVEEIPGNIAVLFIDGDHACRSVRRDFALYFPKVKNGGTIAFHDTWNKLGPCIVSDTLLLFGQVRNPECIDSITSFEKAERITYSERLKNLLFVFWKKGYGFFQVLKKMKNRIG